MPWKVTYDEEGGYDCMTPAFIVRHAARGEQIVVDTKDFGWIAYEDQPQNTRILIRCKAIADRIATALNQET